jgi:hypothetical protein
MPPYPELNHEEDTKLVDSIRASHRIAMNPVPGTYCYVIHGANSWGDSHWHRNLRQAEKVASGDQYIERMRQIASVMPVAEYARELARRQLEKAAQ